MKMLFSLKRKYRLFALFTILFMLSLCLSFFSADNNKNAKNDKDRRDFINNLGIIPQSSDCTKKTVYIPLEFKAVYENYNQLQKEAGYDLSPYKGEKVTLYSYKIKDNPEYFVNLLVYKDRVIGGDISSFRLDGNMYPLKKEIYRFKE